jgi:hypothetical protein
MKTILLLLTLTIGNSYSAPIPINSVPVSISSPGTYQVTSNLVCTAGTPAISVNSAGAGKIIIDLEGFTISAVGNPISGVSIKNPTNSSIIVRNGTLSGFNVGVDVNPLVLDGFQTFIWKSRLSSRFADQCSVLPS